jgi:uncharacterized delta-60 repeat protein
MPPRLSLSFCALLAFFAMWSVTAHAFAAAGDLDPSFSDDGIAEVDFGSHSTYEHPPSGAFARPIGLQPNGDLIVAGYSQYVESTYYLTPSSRPELSLAAVRPDGSLDPSFGDGGILEGDLGTGLATPDVLVQPDGRILLGGFGTRSGVRGIYVARLTATGQLDTSFSDNGVAMVGQFDFGQNALALQPDGRIVIANAVGGPAGHFDPDTLALYRLTADGSADGTFVTGGNVQLPPGDRYREIGSMEVDPAGRILVSTAVMSADPPYGQRLAVTRFLADGRLDPTYGDSGTYETAANETFAVRSSVDSMGRAYMWLPPDGSGFILTDRASQLLRLTADGAPDPAFGVAGKQELPPYAAGNGISPLPSGAIAVPVVSDGSVTVLRMTADGKADPTFASQSWRTQPRCLPTIYPSTYGLPDGSVVLAGADTVPYYGSPGTPDRVLVARYLGDGQAGSQVSPDPPVADCPPCEDSVVRECVPYDTKFMEVTAQGRTISGGLQFTAEACTQAQLAAIDRRRGRTVRVASTHPTDIAGTHAGLFGSFSVLVPQRVRGKVFIRLRPVGEAADCAPSQSDPVRIRSRR